MQLRDLRECLLRANAGLAYLTIKHNALRAADEIYSNLVDHKMTFNREVIKEYKKKWGVLDSFISTKYFKIYSTYNNSVDLNYVPDDLYRHKILPRLSDLRFSYYVKHKGLLALRRPDLKEYLAGQVLYKIDGKYYDIEYREVFDLIDYLRRLEDKVVVVKESVDSCGGEGVSFFYKDDNNDGYYSDKRVSIIDYLKSSPDVVVQKKIVQSDFMSRFNESSVNTFRVITYRSVKDNKVHILHTAIRFGQKGALLDNLFLGGIIVPINKGFVAEYGLNEKYLKVSVDTELRVKIPYLEQINSLAIKVAEKEYFNRELFLDICIDQKDVAKLLEINIMRNCNLQTIFGPAFGEFTDEVIEFCKNNSANYTFYANVKSAKRL